MPVWIPWCHITFPALNICLNQTPCFLCMQGLQGKHNNNFPTFYSWPALLYVYHPILLPFFFLSPALPITWQGYREVPVWADSPSFHWISPSRKTNKTNTATKSKINKTSHPKHFGFSSPSTQLIPVNLILATSHTWSHQSQKCQAGIEGCVSHLADIWWQPLKPCFNIPHPPFKYQTLNLQLHCPAFSTSVP